MLQKIIKFIRTNALILFLITCALLGVWASLALMVDQVNLLANKNPFVECNINPLFSCTKVMNTEYASMWGIPNPVFGLIGYSAIAAFLGLLLVEKKFNKLPMLVVLLFNFAAFVFSYVLIGISMFIIHAFCPLCLGSAFAATNLFFGTLYINFHQGNLGKKISESNFAKRLFTARNYLLVVIGWFVGVCLAIYIKYPTIISF